VSRHAGGLGDLAFGWAQYECVDLTVLQGRHQRWRRPDLNHLRIAGGQLGRLRVVVRYLALQTTQRGHPDGGALESLQALLQGLRRRYTGALQQVVRDDQVQ